MWQHVVKERVCSFFMQTAVCTTNNTHVVFTDSNVYCLAVLFTCI